MQLCEESFLKLKSVSTLQNSAKYTKATHYNGPIGRYESSKIPLTDTNRYKIEGIIIAINNDRNCGYIENNRWKKNENRINKVDRNANKNQK